MKSMSFQTKYELVDVIYHSLCGAYTLLIARRYGQDSVAQFMFNRLRSAQSGFLLQGLKKLGLEQEATDAIKCAKYHYLANALGGMDMEYVEETPEKVWIRYLAPFLFSDSPFSPSVSIAGLSQAYELAGLKGWHAHNGVILGNARLGFVVTQLIVNGAPFDAGYFKIFDHDLSSDETLQLNFGEEGPPFDPARAPKLDPKEWPPERRAKAFRNYAVEHALSFVEGLQQMYGVSEACSIIRQAYQITFASRYKQIMQTLQIPYRDTSGLETKGSPTSAKGVATLLQRMAALLDEEITVEEVSGDKYILRQSARNPRFFPNLSHTPVEVDEAILEGWRVLVYLINRELTVDMTSALTAGDSMYEWVVRPRRERERIASL